MSICTNPHRVSFVDPLLDKATKDPLNIDDLGVIPQKVATKNAHATFESYWSEEKKKPEKERKLVTTILKSGGAVGLFLAGILHCIGELVNLVPTYIINTLVSDLEDPFLSRCEMTIVFFDYK